MSRYKERVYRKKINGCDLVSFHVMVKQTDLWVSADINLEDYTRDLVFDCRHEIETYITSHPEFATSLLPLPKDPFAPPLIKEMIKSSGEFGIGPMASVAGAIAQYVADGLSKLTDQVIVENGGDVFLYGNRPMTVAIFAGNSPLSERFGLLIPEKMMPVGVCSSSATVGHSLSMGVADVVCLLSYSGALADSAATALCNRIKKKKDLERVADWAGKSGGILGGIAIVDDRMATWGEIELLKL